MVTPFDNMYKDIKCISYEEAFRTLVRHFMGDNYYVVEPISTRQANYAIVQEVKAAYPRGSIRIIHDRGLRKGIANRKDGR